MKKKRQGKELLGAYYNRTMNKELESVITTKFEWLIQLVKEHECLDFQTGWAKGRPSWFSIYRGTSRILSIAVYGKSIKLDAAESYKALLANWFTVDSLNQDSFKEYLDKIDKNEKFGRYYINNTGENKEGYYQNLISRRYTIGLKPEDDFVIVDKELVIGFESDIYKQEWNKQIVEKQTDRINNARNLLSGTRLPEKIKPEYGEFDFLAIDKSGNFIIMELKQNDGAKTYLSPVQTNYYVMQFEKLIKEKGKSYLCDAIRTMYEQKVRMGLINKGWTFPEKMNCEVKACVVVGNKKGISEETCRRFKIFKEAFLPSIGAYMATSDIDGTLKICDFLTYRSNCRMRHGESPYK